MEDDTQEEGTSETQNSVGTDQDDGTSQGEDSSDEETGSQGSTLGASISKESFMVLLNELKHMRAHAGEQDRLVQELRGTIATLNDTIKGLNSALASFQVMHVDPPAKEPEPSTKTATGNTVQKVAPRETPAEESTNPETPEATKQQVKRRKSTAGLSSDEEQAAIKQPRIGEASTSTQATQSPQETQNAQTTRVAMVPQARQDKIPPVMLRDGTKWKTVSQWMREKKIMFSKAKLTTDGIAITTESPGDHRNLTRLLSDKKLEYHTYTLPEEKKLRVVIRGLPDSIEPDEVSMDLQSKGFTPLSVHRMKSLRTKKPIPLVLVQVPQGEGKILEVTRCCQLVVRVEPQNAKTNPTQCHRCQRFGHAQSWCTANPKCVKCGDSHSSTVCPKDKTLPAKCANCGGDHPASYLGCPKAPKRPMRKPGQGQRRVPPAATANQVSFPAGAQATSYAEAARPRRTVAGAPAGTPSPSAWTPTMDMASQMAMAQGMFAQLSKLLLNMSSSIQGNV